MSGTADGEVVRSILDGEANRFAELVARYQDTLFRHALGMVGDSDSAADLVQDSFVKAYTHLSTCDDPERFGAWIFRIVRNRCMDHLKNRRQHGEELKEDTATAHDDPALLLDRSELSDLLGGALARLPEAQREAFLLKHAEGRSYEEMAEMLDASVSALKMRVMRAREALQDLLRDRV